MRANIDTAMWAHYRCTFPSPDEAVVINRALVRAKDMADEIDRLRSLILDAGWPMSELHKPKCPWCTGENFVHARDCAAKDILIEADKVQT